MPRGGYIGYDAPSVVTPGDPAIPAVPSYTTSFNAPGTFTVVQEDQVVLVQL
jgi:hypothetical protein